MAWHSRRMVRHSIAYTNMDSIALANRKVDTILKYQRTILLLLIHSFVMLPYDLI
jgi:hypothetical protein